MFALDSHTFDQPPPRARGDAGEDGAQLAWLRESLVASWLNPRVRGRILVLHHPPYATEASKWKEPQTLAVRRHLRAVLDQVAARVGPATTRRPLLNLVLTGHAHCLELLRSGSTGHGDSHIPWLICGGGGYSLRRQRAGGSTLRLTLTPLLAEQVSGRWRSGPMEPITL